MLHEQREEYLNTIKYDYENVNNNLSIDELLLCLAEYIDDPEFTEEIEKHVDMYYKASDALNDYIERLITDKKRGK